MNRNNVSFGEFWEFSRLINYKVQKDIYWKRKLNKKIQRAFFLRDYKSLAALIQHCYNLRTKNESVYCSTGMILLMSNISLLKYHDGEYVSIFMEYNRKFSKRLKSEERELIRDICKKQNYTRLAKKFLEELKRRIRHKNFAIEDVSDLRGYLSLIKVEPQTNVNGMIKLLRKDPCIDIDLTKIYKELEKEDWVILINRVDRLNNDYESWKCLEYFLESNDDMDLIDDVRNYVNDYWPKYHLISDYDDLNLKGCEVSVFQILGLEISINS